MAIKKAKKRAPSKKMVVLPTKPSALIKIALADIRKAEKQRDKYVIDMSVYFQPDEDMTCQVNDTIIEERKVCVMCAAGSVMAFTLGKAGTTASLDPTNFPKNHDQLKAIDALRTGDATEAGWYLGSSIPTHLDTNIPEYNNMNPEPFHKAMTAFGAKLKKAGF